MSEALKKIEERDKHWQAVKAAGTGGNFHTLSAAALSADVVRLARALDALGAKLREVEASIEYRAAFTLAQIHGQPYTGPNSWDEQRAAERVLAEVAGMEEER